jgi:hypothetical protein
MKTIIDEIRVGSCAVLTTLLLLGVPARGQELPPATALDSAAKVKALEEAVKALQGEMASLKAVAETSTKAKAEAAPVEPKSEALGVDGSRRKLPMFEAHGQLHNLLIFRNDTDFDRRKPLYNENGQTSGTFATVFAPTLQWNLTDKVHVFYEAEIGLNYWSKNNPDQENALSKDIFILKHRQIYAEGELANGRFGFKVGYQYFTDTTALFLGHWIGAAQVWHSWAKGQKMGLYFGMIPDSTYEGLDITMNNFRHDIFTFGGRTDLTFGKQWNLNVGVHALYDTHVVDRTRWLVAPNLHLEGRSDWLANNSVKVSGALDGVVQCGKSNNSALDGRDQHLLAWAAQGNVKVETKPVALSVNVLALSPDDAYQGNSKEGAFFYSSKSTSPTVYFTEDETRNWYDQLDRRMGRFDGGFYQHRAGLMLSDLKLTLQVVPWFRPSIIVGYGIVLQPKNALGERNLGFEGNIDLAFLWTKHLVARVMFGGMQPGKAAGALLNQIAPQEKKTDGMWWTEAGLSVIF